MNADFGAPQKRGKLLPVVIIAGAAVTGYFAPIDMQSGLSKEENATESPVAQKDELGQGKPQGGEVDDTGSPEVKSSEPVEPTYESELQRLGDMRPQGDLAKLGLQEKHPLGGMNTPRAEFATYPVSLGPTGIFATRAGKLPAKHTYDRKGKARSHYVVTSLASGSPAAGKLQKGDVIYGVNGEKFDVGSLELVKSYARFPNPQMGLAIEAAEASESGVLELLVRRGGQEMKVAVTLPKLGAMGDEFPSRSAKAEWLASVNAEILAAQQLSAGGWATGIIKKGNVDTRAKLLTTCVAGMALMSTEDSRYDEQIKKAYELVLGWPVKSFHTWQYAYKAAFFTEYHLRYGDKRCLPEVKKMVDALSTGYFYYNGIYGYGHSLNGGNYRYGGINVCTGHACYVFAMAKVLGIEVPNNMDVLMAKSIERLAPDGGMDYTWGARRKGVESMDTRRHNEHQGRTGIAAMAYYYLGGTPEHHEKMVSFLCRNAEYADCGHAAGCTLSWLWGSLGIAMSDDERFASYMKEKVWQFAFNRQWNYGYYIQPSPHDQHRGSDMAQGGTYVLATNVLLFNAPKKNLLVTGRKDGVPQPKSVYAGEILAATDYFERQDRVVEVAEAINLMGRSTPASAKVYFEMMSAIPVEAPDYESRLKTVYESNLPGVLRDVANASMNSKTRSAALAALLGVNYNVKVSASNGRFAVRHTTTPPNVGGVKVIATIDGVKPMEYAVPQQLQRNSVHKVQRGKLAAGKTVITGHTKVRWNDIQIDIPLQADVGVLADEKTKDGVRGKWSRMPWDTVYGPFNGVIKKTKRNGCLQVHLGGGVLFESALMGNALVHENGKALPFEDYIKRKKIAGIPEGAKVRFSYFNRGGNVLTPMCDQIEILK